MPAMEISPRELRDAEIPDSFRGYNRDTVDEFLERAAATIEALQERNRQLTERLQAALAAAETAAKQAPAPAPAPVPAPAPEPAPVVVETPPPAPVPVPGAAGGSQPDVPQPAGTGRGTIIITR